MARFRALVFSVSVGLVAVVAATATGQARGDGNVPVPQGIGPAALTPASAFGDTPPDTPETVSFVLDLRNQLALQILVQTGMPHGYLSVSDFANRYGQSQSNISALESYLSRYGISSSALPDGLEVIANGTAGQFDQALSVRQQQFVVPPLPPRFGHLGRPGFTIHGTKQSPLLPRNLARFVLAILGLTNYPAFDSESVRTQVPAGASPQVVQNGDLTPADYAKLYNLDPLYTSGATGAGRTIGIVTLASVDPSVPEYFWSTILDIATKPNRISLVDVDGGSGPVSDAADSGETTLDVEQSGALAPQSDIVVYQAPNTDQGFVDGFFRAASDNTADSVSSSWGESETEIELAVKNGESSPGYASSFDEAFLEMAAQGQSGFASSGDFGPYTAIADAGTTNLSNGNPDSSPWITSAGGTTLPGTIPLPGGDSATIAAERTWAWDWLWPHYADFGAPSEEAFAFVNPIGGGGGYSALESMPLYQQLIRGSHDFSAVQYLTPTDFQPVGGINLPTAWSFNPSPSVSRGVGSGRATPDISTDADPWTGYVLWFTFGDEPATLQTGWGGTSFGAPQLNGAAALIDSLLGKRTGFWNPPAYQLARQSGSPFTPLDTASTDNDNLYYTGTPGHLFNVGSGLGTPDLAKLAAAFAHNLR